MQNSFSVRGNRRGATLVIVALALAGLLGDAGAGH